MNGVSFVQYTERKKVKIDLQVGSNGKLNSSYEKEDPPDYNTSMTKL